MRSLGSSAILGKLRFLVRRGQSSSLMVPSKLTSMMSSGQDIR